MNKWIAEFDLEDGDTMPEHMDLNYMGAKIDFHCRPMWIFVSEKLPDIHNYSDNYLVTLERGGVHIAMFTECNGKHWWTYDDVVAWMPLPKPYVPQESEVNNG